MDGLQISLAVMLLTYVWRLQNLYPILTTLQATKLSTLAALGFFFLNQDPRRSLKVLKHPMMKGLAGFLALMVASVPLSMLPIASIRYLVVDFSKTALFAGLLAMSVRHFEDLERYALVHVFGAGIYAFYGITSGGTDFSGRLSAAYYDANGMTLLWVCTIPLAIYFAYHKKNVFIRAAMLAVVACMLLAIVKASSRGGFLGLVAVCGAIVVLFRQVPKKVRVGSVAGLLLGLVLVGGEDFWGRMETILHPTDDPNWAGNAEGGRMAVWKRGVGYMASHPLTGVGVRMFIFAEGRLAPQADRQQYGYGWKWSVAHNSFVQVGAELGVFGLILFIWLWMKGFRTALSVTTFPRAPPELNARATFGRALGACVIGFVVSGFFLSFAYKAFTWGLVAFLGAFGTIVAEEVRKGTFLPVGAPAKPPVGGPVKPSDGDQPRYRRARSRRRAAGRVRGPEG